jgi:hypothetical protein
VLAAFEVCEAALVDLDYPHEGVDVFGVLALDGGDFGESLFVVALRY